MKKTRKKSILIISSIAVLAAAMVSIGIVLAIVAKNTESRRNQFTFSNADIELTEPNWKDNPVVYPGAAYAKDPTVENTGANPLYVYLQIKIPRTEVNVIETANGKESVVEKEHDLMRYTPDPITANWIKIVDGDDEGFESFNEVGYHVLVYAYREELAPGENTSPLFNTIIFSEDILEGDPGVGTSLNMPIAAYAIQSKYLNTEDGELEKQLAKAFEKYMNVTQNQS